jgi:SPP1 family predicted phage head-tail adaptor
MDTGSLNQRISIERHEVGQDEIGQPIEAWVPLYSVWANIRHLSGREAIKSDASVSITKASIRIRYLPGVDAGMRVSHGGKFYDIEAVLPNAIAGLSDLVCEVVA